MKQIIVIEDDNYMRQDIQDVLELEGFETIGARNGQEGIELIRQHNPDLILCDIWMPSVDGYQVLTTIRQDEASAKTPFLFLTANNNQQAMEKGFALGASGYIIKPFAIDQLLQKIAEFLG